jgi:hypothetical protein
MHIVADPVSFISDLIVHFPVRHDSPEREKAWTLSMVSELRGYSASVLKAASAEIIRTRTDRRFPLPKECRDACENIKRAAELAKRAAALPITAAEQFDQRRAEYSQERERLADDMIKGPDGRQAAKEGWVGTLHTFILRNGRMPHGHEIATCKRQARECDEAYQECVRGGWPQAKSLEELGAAMLANRKRLTEMALGVQR